MNDKEKAKIQIAEQCAETREEDLGYQMVRHYNYLSSLNHEWSNLCELAVKMYLPNKKYINKLEQQLKEAVKRNEKLKECVLRIANKKWFGEVHNDARNTLEEVYKTNE